MNANILLMLVIIPLVAAILILAIRRLSEIIALLATGSMLIIAIALFRQNLTYSLSLPWAGFGIEFIFRLYHFSAFILLAITAFAFLIVLYSCSFMHGKNYVNQFYSYLLIPGPPKKKRSSWKARGLKVFWVPCVRSRGWTSPIIKSRQSAGAYLAA